MTKVKFFNTSFNLVLLTLPFFASAFHDCVQPKDRRRRGPTT